MIMAEYALLINNVFQEFRHFREEETQPVDLPHKSVRWLPVVREYGEAFEGTEGSNYVIRTVDPSTLPPPVPEKISDQQFFQQLAIMELITEQEAEEAVAPGTIPASLMALVEQLPEAQQWPARMLLKGSVEFRRNHPMTAVIAQLYGFTPEQVDDLFRAASAL